MLEQFTRAARSLLDLERLKGLLVQTAVEGAGTDRGCLLFLGGSSGLYAVESVHGSWPRELLELSLTSTDDLVRALKDRKFPVWEQELLVNPELEYLRALCRPFFENTGTSVVVPVIQEESVIAILCLGNRASDGLYATEDLRFLSTLANAAASSIAVALNYREIERQLSIQTFLFVLSESLVRYAGSAEAIRSAIGVLQSFLGIDECYVLTLETPGEVLVHAPHLLDPRLELHLKQVGRALISGEAGRMEQPLFSGALDARSVQLPGFEAEADLARSLQYLPLTSGGELLGFLAVAGAGGQDDARDSGALSGAFRAILSQGLLAIRHVSELRSLKEYNEKVLASLGTSGEMLFVMDAGGTILRTNAAAAEALGVAETELTGSSFRRILDPQSPGATAEEFLRSASGRVVQNWELQFRGRHQRRIPVLVSSAYIPRATSGALEIVVLARDISLLREAERERQESRQRYQSLFESVLDAVVTFRDDGELIDMNPAGREMFAAGGRDQPAPNLLRDFLVEPQRFEALRRELAQRGSIRDFELRLRTPGDGRGPSCSPAGATMMAPPPAASSMASCATSRSSASCSASSCRRRRWRAWGRWPGESRTISTTSSPPPWDTPCSSAGRSTTRRRFCRTCRSWSPVPAARWSSPAACCPSPGPESPTASRCGSTTS